MEIISDYLIIGSGVAGLSTALKLASIGSVSIVTKREAEESSTKYAQGGIASVISEVDSFDAHIKDTLQTGSGLSHNDIVEITVKNGPRVIKELLNLGVKFTRRNINSDELDLGKEGGHSKRRIVHAHDMTGQELERVLLHHIQKNSNINSYEHHVAIDLILADKCETPKKCMGAYVLNKKTGEVIKFLAKHTILATGGSGKVYLYTSNPDTATGDGVAMAYRAGAKIANMEFFQFHPTCLYEPKAKNFLISEAVRGEGGILKRIDGTLFMKDYHPQGELAPRDIVSRAIDSELKRTGDDYVYLDISHLKADFIKNRFPGIYSECSKFGFDITQDPIPVVPAAHYQCGGIVTDVWGMVLDFEGLWAVGENSQTGLHGANRLASNSLLEGLVFAERVSMAIKDKKIEQRNYKDIPDWITGDAITSDESVFVTQSWDEIRRLMWNYVGIVRSDRRLLRAKKRIDFIWQEINEYYWKFLVTSDLLELRNIATIADLIIAAASFRKESRGLHYTIDYPKQDNKNWKGEIILQKDSLPKLNKI